MESIPNVVGVLSCGCLLCLGLSNAAQINDAPSAADNRNAGQSERKGRQVAHPTLVEQLTGVHTVQGEVMRVEGASYFVKGQDGKEVSLYVDQNTRKTGNINPGDRIEAKVNLLNHARSIREAPGTDAGHGHEAGLSIWMRAIIDP